jgi:hypothetical protein
MINQTNEQTEGTTRVSGFPAFIPKPMIQNFPTILEKMTEAKCANCGKALMNGECPDCPEVIRL